MRRTRFVLIATALPLLLASACGGECRYDTQCPNGQRCTLERTCVSLGGTTMPDASGSDAAADAGAMDAGNDAGTMDSGSDAMPMLPATLACAREPLPNTLAMDVTQTTLEGRVVTLSMATPVEGATVAAYEAGADVPAAMATTAMDGTFVLTLPLPGPGPFAGKLRISASGYRDSEYFFPYPLDGALGVTDSSWRTGDIVLSTEDDWTASSTTYGQTTARGLGIVWPTACDGTSLADVSVTTDAGPPLQVYYPTMDDPTVTTPSPEAPKALLVNAPADVPLMVTVNFGSGVSRTVPFQLRAGVLSYLILSPHGALADGS